MVGYRPETGPDRRLKAPARRIHPSGRPKKAGYTYYSGALAGHPAAAGTDPPPAGMFLPGYRVVLRLFWSLSAVLPPETPQLLGSALGSLAVSQYPERRWLIGASPAVTSGFSAHQHLELAASRAGLPQPVLAWIDFHVRHFAIVPDDPVLAELRRYRSILVFALRRPGCHARRIDAWKLRFFRLPIWFGRRLDRTR